MRINGQFTTRSTVGALLELDADLSQMTRVPVLHDVTALPGGAVSALFTPATRFGRLPIGVTIVRHHASTSGAALQVQGRQGPHLFDVDLALTFTACAAGTEVSWEAEFVARGPAASVGQRVAGDVATRAINDVLVAVATGTDGA